MSTGGGIQACVFDLGNVLLPFDHAKTRARIREHCEVAPETRLAELTVLAVEHECGRLPEKDLFDGITILLGYRGAREFLVEAWCDIFGVNEPMVTLARELREAGMPCHILSNAGSAHIRFAEKRFAFLRMFNGRIYSFKEGTMKPDAAIFERAITKLKLDPARTLYIDDKPENVEAGRAAGFVAVCYDQTDHASFLLDIPRERLPSVPSLG